MVTIVSWRMNIGLLEKGLPWRTWVAQSLRKGPTSRKGVCLYLCTCIQKKGKETETDTHTQSVYKEWAYAIVGVG